MLLKNTLRKPSLVQSVGKAGIVGLAKIMFTDTIPAAAF